jgi:hypothetical protein
MLVVLDLRKGHCHENFYSGFFRQTTFSGPIRQQTCQEIIAIFVEYSSSYSYL